MVGNDGTMGLWRIWTISHGHLDHSRDCHRSRYRVAPAIGFLVMCWRSLTVDARPFSTRTSRPESRRSAGMGRKVPGKDINGSHDRAQRLISYGSGLGSEPAGVRPSPRLST